MQASLRAAAKQTLNLAVLILVVSTVLFFLLRLTGDPAAVLAGPDATAEQLAAIRRAYGLDQPLAVQFFSYIGQMLRGDFGRSLATSQPAIELVLASLPATLFKMRSPPSTRCARLGPCWWKVRVGTAG